MITTIEKKADGTPVKVTWERHDKVEAHDPGWTEYNATGEGEDGSQWQGSMFGCELACDWVVDYTEQVEEATV